MMNDNTNNNSKKIGNPSFAEEAESDLGFALDNLRQIETTCCNIDGAIDYVQKAVSEIKKYFEWAGISGEVS